jgi:heme/copper-type cytochrome/quinol oxidase subunit 2
VNVLVIKKRWVYVAVVGIIIMVVGWYTLLYSPDAATTGLAAEEELTIHMTTVEFKTTTDDGREIEAYRWDPGTIFVPKNQVVKLNIYGVNGHEHPFHIEGTDIEGTVKKGESTTVDLHFTESGIYRLICSTHLGHEESGPMIGYIVVR